MTIMTKGWAEMMSREKHMLYSFMEMGALDSLNARLDHKGLVIWRVLTLFIE